MDELLTWAARVGFGTIYTNDADHTQVSCECGVIAAWVASKLLEAGPDEFTTVDLSEALSSETRESGYEGCGVTVEAQETIIAEHRARAPVGGGGREFQEMMGFYERRLSGLRNSSQQFPFLTESEVERALVHFTQERSLTHVDAEYARQRVTPKSAMYRKLATVLDNARSRGEQTPLDIAISNTSDFYEQGFHFFTVAFSITSRSP